MSKLNKIDYSKRKTLENLWENYSFKLKNKIEVLWIKEWVLKKHDKIVIKKITLKNDKPHHVCFYIERDWKKVKEIVMSGWVFLNNFISQINPEDIILKNKEEHKEKVEKIINKKD